MREADAPAAVGSSPRMRGSLTLPLVVLDEVGIIPAHAGLTRAVQQQSPRRRDHPRACGAHLYSRTQRICILGSSPRMRGSLVLGAAAMAGIGIIPAHAGLTESCSDFGSSIWDHPRACGAHRLFLIPRIGAEGSSPRMRGSLHIRPLILIKMGIIPAHAGLTCYGRRNSHGDGDHPRACGAHRQRWPPRPTQQGSSPRMRGSRIDDAAEYNELGIIPAHAGLTQDKRLMP